MGRSRPGSAVRSPDLAQPRHDTDQIRGKRNQDSPEGHAEPIDLTESRIGSEQAEPYAEQEGRLEQEIRVCEGQVAVHETEENGSQAVARVEADPCPPHGRLTGDHGRDLSHPVLERGVSRRELRTTKGVDQVHDPERQEHGGAQDHGDSGDHPP